MSDVVTAADSCRKGAFMQIGMARGVANEIRSQIESSGLAPGEKLPTESTLMQRYGVSRSTVREAMKLLQAENVVEIRRGLGSFVASKTGIGPDPLGLRFEEQAHLLEELMEVRLLLEPGIAECAARRRGDADIALMEKAISDMEKAAENGEDYDAYDYRFHTAVAEGTHNRVLERMFPVILEAIGRQVEKYNNLNPECGIQFTCGKAVSSADGIFEIRDLLRLAIQRMRAGQISSVSRYVSAGNAAADAQD